MTVAVAPTRQRRVAVWPLAARSSAAPLAEAAALTRRARCSLAATVVGLEAAVLAPLLGAPTLQLLDYGAYPVGPHPPVPLSSYGFPPDLTSRAPVFAALDWLFHAVPLAALTLLPFALVAPLSCLGFARVLRGRALAIGAATVVYTVNPFVYERMAAGQVYVVMGYALLPLLLGLVVRPLPSLLGTACLGGILYALAIALSVHYLFLAGAVLAVMAVAHAAARRRRSALAGAAICAVGAVLSLYWLVPAAASGVGASAGVTGSDLAAFRTAGDPTVGLFGNVLGLYGFFRPGTPLVKDALAGWPLVLLAMLLVVAFGLVELARRGGRGRALASGCLVLCVLGALAAMGAQGPTGALYSWCFAHVPGFRVLREAQKFDALVALGYAVGFGAGVVALTRTLTARRARVLAAVALLAIPLAYGYTELWGFSVAGQRSATPPAVLAADRAMRPGATALLLPWAAYYPVPWLGDRVVANPLASAFDRPVIAADDLEAGQIVSESANPRSAFLQFSLSHGASLHEFGRVLAALGVSYVVVAKAPGWTDYAWLARQGDLHVVLDDADLVVYRSTEVVHAAYAPQRTVTVRDWGAVLAMAARVPLVDYRIAVEHAGPGPLVAPRSLPAPVAPVALVATTSSPIRQTLRLEAASPTVVLTASDFSGWHLSGYRTTSQFGVTVAFRAIGRPPPGEVVAAFGPGSLVRTWDLVGVVLLCCTLVALASAARRTPRRHRSTRAAAD